jgi:hypothetical protein
MYTLDWVVESQHFYPKLKRKVKYFNILWKIKYCPIPSHMEAEQINIDFRKHTRHCNGFLRVYPIKAQDKRATSAHSVLHKHQCRYYNGIILNVDTRLWIATRSVSEEAHAKQ